MFANRLHSDSTLTQNENKSSLQKYKISDTGYGKNAVKIMHVTRNGPVHSIREFEVGTHLKLYTDKDYIKGDNSDIVATDSQKNTVYLLAKKFGIKSPEEFALNLSSHFLKKYNQVKEVHVHVEEYPWKRIDETTCSTNDYKNHVKHNHAFIFTPIAQRYCDVIQTRKERDPIVISGIKGLRVLKTTQSSFVNFVNDEYRTLEDQHDRIFSTIVETNWEYSTTNGVNFCKNWNTVRNIILQNFAGNPQIGIPSPSVQHTLYLSEKEVLDTIPQVNAIAMQLPNCHYFNFDFSRFRSLVANSAHSNDNDVFIPVDKPHGIIYAQLDRKDLNSKL